MFRKDLIERLAARPASVNELAIELEMKPKDVADDLEHLLRSLKHLPYRVELEPARCRHCGFEFASERLRKPGKCPKCRRSWISEPKIGLRPIEHA